MVQRLFGMTQSQIKFIEEHKMNDIIQIKAKLCDILLGIKQAETYLQNESVKANELIRKIEELNQLPVEVVDV